MQIQSLRIKSYRSWRVADSASEAAIARMKKDDPLSDEDQRLLSSAPQSIHQLPSPRLFP